MPVGAAKPPLPSDDKRWRIVNGTMRRHGYARHALIEALHTAQQSFGYLDDETLICMGTACYIKGAGQLVTEAEKILGVKAGETTTDGKASLLTARCLGSCSLAPVAVFDGQMVATAGPAQMEDQLERWLVHDT
jgi:bidirectional [NiFe] hydrogenase diaphorase subunit